MDNAGCGWNGGKQSASLLRQGYGGQGGADWNIPIRNRDVFSPEGFALGLPESLAKCLICSRNGELNRGKKSVGGTPTDATETVALPEKSLRIGEAVSIEKSCRKICVAKTKWNGGIS